MAKARRVKHKAQLGFACEVSITGGPHKDWETGIIAGDRGRYWLVVGTSTKLARTVEPFLVEKCNILPL